MRFDRFSAASYSSRRSFCGQADGRVASYEGEVGVSRICRFDNKLLGFVFVWDLSTGK